MGSILDMEYFLYFHNVNIISISNNSGGRGSFETYRTLSTSVPNDSLNENDTVIYIYHHLYHPTFEQYFVSQTTGTGYGPWMFKATSI